MWRSLSSLRRSAAWAGLAVALGSWLWASGAWAQGPQDVRRISGADTLKAVAEGKAVLLDVRSTAQFESGHAKGALCIPLGELAARLKELPKDKLIIAYCT